EPRKVSNRVLLAQAYNKVGRLDAAFVEAERAIALGDPSGTALWVRGVVRGERDKAWGPAIEDLTASLAATGEDHTIYGTRGRFRGRRGDLDGAIEDLDRAIRLKRSPNHFNDRAEVWLAKGDIERAIADSEECLGFGGHTRSAAESRARLAKLRAK
ncbi:MAG: tetratricopeptide repeat protein, partial [Planctomycetota bacterium]